MLMVMNIYSVGALTSCIRGLTMIVNIWISKSSIHALFLTNCLEGRIRHIRPRNRKEGTWRLLHCNTPAYRSTLPFDFLRKNRILTIRKNASA